MRFNRRWFTRVNYRNTVVIKTPDGMVVEAPVKDLSLRGVYIITDEIIPVGRSVEIFFRDNSSPGRELKVNGIIVRANKKGFAIEFEKMDLSTFCHLKTTVYDFLGKPIVIKELSRFFRTFRR